MTFNSLQFAGFFLVVYLVNRRLDRDGQNWLMIVAGSVFYALFDWRFLGLLYASILLDYVVARGLQTSEDPRRRRLLLAASLTGQLGMLAVFKYLDFFADSAASVLRALGLDADPVTLELLLPVGISFYTFQTLAYVLAVYRRQLDAERSLVTFAAFVSWFPQMAAGPIERATHLLPQVQRRREPPPAAVMESGLFLILRGLVKKVVVADSVATFVTTAFQTPGTQSGRTLAVASVGFAVQVYGDFSGYSDLARGLSRLLGVELRRNFEQPFLSRDIREFWQRWHTSLRWWFTTFVAQPLGGASGSRLRSAGVVVVMFTLIGLWHGASWTFVFWGLLNGVLVAAWRFAPAPRRHPMRLRWREVPQIAFTFALFCLGAVFFRAPSFDAAFTVLDRIVTLASGARAPSGFAAVPLALAIALLLDLQERRARIAAIEGLRIRATLGEAVVSAEEAAAETPTATAGPVRAGVLVGVMLVGLVVFSGGAPVPFIYFAF